METSLGNEEAWGGAERNDSCRWRNLFGFASQKGLSYSLDGKEVTNISKLKKGTGPEFFEGFMVVMLKDAAYKVIPGDKPMPIS